MNRQVMLEHVCHKWNVTAEDIAGPSMDRHVSLARQCYIYLLRENGLKYREVSLAVNRHHSTVMYAHQRIKRLALLRPNFAAWLGRVQLASRAAA